MKYKLLICIARLPAALTACCFLVINLTNNPVLADQQSAWQALKNGGHIALLRHMDAPGPSPDPPGFKLDDCSTQRNLSPKGREDARNMGRRTLEHQVEFQQVLSSPWCRCLDTARLMGFSDVQIEPAFRNAFALSDQRDTILQQGLAVLNGWPGPGNLLVATHGANILDIVGFRPSQGEMVVIKLNQGSINVVGRIQSD